MASRNKDNLIIKDNFPIPTDETYDDITEEGLIEGGGKIVEEGQLGEEGDILKEEGELDYARDEFSDSKKCGERFHNMRKLNNHMSNNTW